MKLTARYLKPFWASVLLCILLLFGQAMSELALPNLMSGLVNTGIQQGGLEAGAPEAMSRKALQLLLFFCGGEDKALLEGGYYTIEPESSEAQRISKDYPLARKEAVCVLREGLEEEARLELDRVYGQAAYGFLLYMQEAAASGELAELALKAAGQGGAAVGPGSSGGTVAPAPGPDGEGPADAPGGLPNIFDIPILGGEKVGSGDSAAGESGGVVTDPNLQLYLEEQKKNPTVATDPNLQMAPQPPRTSSSSDLRMLPGGRESDGPQGADLVWENEPVMGGMAAVGAIEPPGGIENPALPEMDGGFTAPDPGGVESGMGPEGEGASEPPMDDALLDEEKPEFFGEDGAGLDDGQPDGGFDLTDAGGLGNMPAERLYQLLPLLAFAPEESLGHAIAAAADGADMMAGQVGVSLKKLFYTELGVDTAPMQSSYIWDKGLQMLGVALLGALAAVLVGFFSSRAATAVARNLRHDLFAKVMGMGGPEFDKVSIASLITRTTNDVQQVGMLVMMGLRLVCYAPIMGIGGVILAVEKSVSMSWIVAAAVAVMLGLVMVVMAVALPKFKALQGMMDKLNRISREHLSGMMVVRAFGNQLFEEERFREANQEFTHTNRFVQRVMAGMMPAMMLVMNVSSLVIMWVGGHAIAASTLQIGDMMAFIQYAMQIIMSFLMIAMMFVMLPRASVSAARIGEVLDMEPQVRDPQGPAKPAEGIKGVVEFKDVSFRYHDAESDVLEHISFTARPGETTAIIGATGAGKSTLVNLIPRFYDVTGGEITLDGTDIRQYKQEDLRAAIGYVPQKALLFSGTVQENLRYGKEGAEEGELLEALDTAQARGFVEEMEKGLGAYVSQGGANVSGGQRQRLSMARALVRRAPVYIFDDSFSALDFKTEAAVRGALQSYTAEAAVLVVAQRVSTIMHAQQILVLDGGRLVGKGTHRELLESCPAYREIAESQLRKEELA